MNNIVCFGNRTCSGVQLRVLLPCFFFFVWLFVLLSVRPSLSVLVFIFVASSVSFGLYLCAGVFLGFVFVLGLFLSLCAYLGGGCDFGVSLRLFVSVSISVSFYWVVFFLFFLFSPLFMTRRAELPSSSLLESNYQFGDKPFWGFSVAGVLFVRFKTFLR